MINYIVRRILLMIPTLLGITVMVFLIVRFAPGNPVAGPRNAGAISSESRAAVEAYYEKKLGLDQPIWRQYSNWWRSMFSAQIDAPAWTDEPEPRPIHILGDATGASAESTHTLLVKGADGQWMQFVAINTDTAPQVRIVGRPRRAQLSGKFIPLDEQINEDEIRRYRCPATVFAVTLGQSQTSRTTVMYELRRRLPITLLINVIALALIYIIAIPTGVMMAVRRGGRFDVGSNALMLGLWSVPIVLAATVFVGYLTTGGAGLPWFPNHGLSSLDAERLPFVAWLGDRAWHLVLPVICIVYGGFAYLAKQMRAAVLDNLTMEYVRTARAKGVSSRDVVLHHVLRNSVLPLITMFATLLPYLIGGSVIIEKIFNIEGMGLFTFRAVMNRDYDVVQAMALIAGVLNMTGILLADIAYAVVDPRIAFE